MAKFPIKRGDQGPDVVKVQQWINLAAYLQDKPIKVKDDGDFGEKTEKALIAVIGVPQIPESLAKVMAKAVPGMKERAELHRKGQTAPDAKMRLLVDQDQRIFQMLLEIYAIWEKSTDAQRKANKQAFAQAFDAAARLMKRYQKMNGSQQLALAQGFPAKYRPLVERYVKASTGAIGLAPIIIGVIAIGCIIIGGAAAYGIDSWLTPAYSESSVDFKVTSEVRAALNKLPGADQESILKEVEKQLDDAYNAGLKKGSRGGFFSGAKTLAMVAVGGAFYFIVVEPALEKRKARRSGNG